MKKDIENQTGVSPSVIRKRAGSLAVILLLIAVAIVAVSGKQGWQALKALDLLAGFALGVIAGISMARDKSGWG